MMISDIVTTHLGGEGILADNRSFARRMLETALESRSELRALHHEPMYMKDWLDTVDDYLKLTRMDILTTAGRISHKEAVAKAHAEYEKFDAARQEQLSPLEQHFLETLDRLEAIEDHASRGKN